MSQMGFFDADKRLSILSLKGDPLEAISKLMPWEMFRADIESVLSLHSGQSAQTLRADTDRDRVFTARAALEYGLIDQVLTDRS